MSTREELISLADRLIRKNGYNGFSYKDLSASLGIKTASIHYHFPTKADLGVAVVQGWDRRLEQFIADAASNSPSDKIKAFFSLFQEMLAEGRVCIVGSLATVLPDMPGTIQEALQQHAAAILHWLGTTLREGEALGHFRLRHPVRTHALQIVTQLMALVQVARLTQKEDFDAVCAAILHELLIPTEL